jgi:peptidoglycan/xylan/chitin deacetylase (PgdA/CDA1 family)
MKNLLPVLAAVVILAGCESKSTETTKTSKKETDTTSTNAGAKTNAPVTGPIADAATIMSRPQVPILCYHHIRTASGKKLNEYEVSAESFKAQMKMLADSGYHTILPEELYNYLTHGTALPSKPVMLTYDDTDEEQFSIAKAEMDKYGFKGVYFIMTISIGRPNYMTKEQIRQLSDEGHVIASHTWRHDRVDKYLTTPHIDRDTKKIVNNDWDLQLVDTRKKLEEIIGKEIHYFAYPFGIWKKEGIPEIEKRGFKLAFQLSDKRDSTYPLYTVRRMIVVPTWSPAGVLKVMKSNFR